jgi:hypothetical protein
VIGVIGEIRLPCKFHIFGCKFVSSVHDISDHQINCSLKPYKCPVADCNLDIQLDGVKMHLNTKQNVKLCTQIRVQGIKSSYEFGSCVWHKGITYREEFFVHLSEMNSDRLYTCVLHIGPITETSKFRYVAKISGPNGKKRAQADHAVRNYAEGFDRIVSLGACASFSPDITQSLLGKRKSLPIEVKIYFHHD